MASPPIGCASARRIDFGYLSYRAEECDCGPSPIGQKHQLDLGE
jgi:hypothetical protein